MIEIRNIQGQVIHTFYQIPKGSKRKFELMKEDYILLRFSLAEPVTFGLGCYAEHEGARYEVTDLQAPTYNKKTDGYDYELRMDAYYWKWKNKLFKYLPESTGQEASWNLTATLDVHAGIILRNLKALGYAYKGTEFSFSIDSSVENKPQLMSYSNISILDALFEMAKKWECECWVTDNIIHFGRCEFGSSVNFEIGKNVENMSRSDSKSDFATRLYVFGSEKNIPVNYRKKLVFTANDVIGNDFRDSSKIITTKNFLKGDVDGIPTIKLQSENSSHVGRGNTSYSVQLDLGTLKKGVYQFSNKEKDSVFISLLLSTPFFRIKGDVSFKVSLVYNTNGHPQSLSLYNKVEAPNRRYIKHFIQGFTFSLTEDAQEAKLEIKAEFEAQNSALNCDLKLNAIISTANSASANVLFLSGKNKGNTYRCVLNADKVLDATKSTYLRIQENVTVEVGDTFAITNIDRSSIPSSYFDVSDNLVVNGVVQKRLMLPEGTPCIDAYPDMATEEAIEQVVVFDDIYPKTECVVGKVDSYTSTVKDESTEEPNDTITETFYYVTDTSGFTFRKDYILENEELKILFQSGKLNGMEFGCTFRAKGETLDDKELQSDVYEIVANEDYGRKLPDSVLCPSAGDKFILIGWDSTKLGNTSLITTAEKELKDKGEKAMEKKKIDPSTYSCKMMSDTIYSSDGLHNLYEAGQKVNLINKSYFENGRVSRIIGFEYALDMPYDSPIYTVGETASYSRIANLEDKIEELTLNGQTYTGGSGGGIYLIKTNDSTPPTESNTYSARRILKELSNLLHKDKPDETNFIIKFFAGLLSDNIQSLDFSSGPFGSGFLLKRDPITGKSYIETDELYVRLKAYFETLEIKHLSHVGGRICLSPASMECVRVEEIYTDYEIVYDSVGSRLLDSKNDTLQAVVANDNTAFRCYFKKDDGEVSIKNEFEVGDLAQCREFNIETGVHEQVTNQYYWRQVIGVGEDFIDLSKPVCDTGSMVPKAGDTIVTIGNNNNPARQHVMILSAYDDDAPSIKLYSGINSFSMKGKEVTVISPNADKNIFTGQVVIKPGSTGFDNFTDAPDLGKIEADIQGAKEDAASAKADAIKAQNSVSDLNSYVDGAFSDGIISESEAKAIEKYINIVNKDKEAASHTYNALYSNPYLKGTAKDTLANRWNDLSSSITRLTNSINKAIADSKTTSQEKQVVDADFATFNTNIGLFNNAVEMAQKSIEDNLKSYSDNAQQAADEAKNAASAAMSSAQDARKAVTDLNSYVDGAFSDGIISESEAKAIEKYINIVNKEKDSASSTFRTLYANPYLEGSAKVTLQNRWNDLSTAINNLLGTISTAIGDGKTTQEEKSKVDTDFNAFNSKYALFNEAISNAQKSIEDNLKSYSDNAQQAADEAKNAASAAMSSAQDARKAVTDLNSYVDGAFSDGIISESEARAIEKYINIVNNTKKDADSTYDALYTNIYLEGTAKQMLLSTKKSFDTAVDNLLSSISTAIADGKTTAQEKQNVDNNYASFSNAFGSLQTSIEKANDAIRDKIRKLAAQDALRDSLTQIETATSAVKDEVAKKMGYESYAQLEEAARLGQTVIQGGLINTSLINAKSIITSALIAEAIRTAELNVNDKFKVKKDGSVEMNGIMHSLGVYTEMVVADGYLRILYNGEEKMRLSVNEDNGSPELFMTTGSSTSARQVYISPNLLSFRLNSGALLQLDPTDIGHGKIKKLDDGRLGIITNEHTFYSVHISSSPTHGGTTSPVNNTSKTHPSGYTEYVSAEPAEGWRFDHWSDGGAQTHIVTWDSNKSITAYFTEIPVNRYTLTLSVSPSGSGTVSGSGTYKEGEVATVNATAADGYRFVKWSDGYQYPNRTITMTKSLSLTAQFEVYQVTQEEILLKPYKDYSQSYKNGTAGTFRHNWFGDVLQMIYEGQADWLGNDMAMMTINRGSLGGKLKQGHKYSLSFTAATNSSSLTALIVAGVVEVDVSGGNASTGKYMDDGNGVIYGEEVVNKAKKYEAIFTANRDSNVSDCVMLVFVPQQNDKTTITVSGISLKEI